METAGYKADKVKEAQKNAAYAAAKTAFKSKAFEPRQFTVKKSEGLDYSIGDTVQHIKFGCGVVAAIVEGGKDYEVTVDFESAGRKKMFASFAKLKKV